MSMSFRAAWRYLDENFHMDEQEDETNAHLLNDIMFQKHKPWCRTHMSEIAPNYGSECTCGLRSMEEMVREKWDEGPEAVAVWINGQADWTEAR
jgi:hypothetical protein